MKKIFVLLPLILINLFSRAQSNFRMGINYNFGASTYYGTKMNAMEMSGSEMPVYSLKLSSGMGVKIQYSIKEKWSINLSGSYQQRGAMFDKGIYSYNPRYKFNYLDLVFGTSYQTKEVIKKSKLCFSAAGTYNFLLNSARVNNYESLNLINDSKMSDFGVFASVGLNIPRSEKDIFQLTLFANTGFKNVFNGVLLDNGMVGKNLLFGLQIGYLFGFK
jgi:hypothetical protein